MKQLTADMQDDEYADAQEAAQAAEMTMAEYARWCVVLQTRALLDRDEDTIDQPWGEPVKPANQEAKEMDEVYERA